jgi:uncharacterized membrane protein YcgQ (UPF0703/DUF1980 family)
MISIQALLFIRVKLVIFLFEEKNMTEEIKPYIIRPVNYFWVVTGMVALLTWQTIITIQSLMNKGIEGSNTQLMVYLLVLCLAFALKESALKPIRVMDHHCVLKTVMAREVVTYKEIEKIELITKKGQMRTTYDLKLVKENPVFIKDIAVYSKSDIDLVVKKIDKSSSMSDNQVNELLERLNNIRFTKS